MRTPSAEAATNTQTTSWKPATADSSSADLTDGGNAAKATPVLREVLEEATKEVLTGLRQVEDAAGRLPGWGTSSPSIAPA
jgi:hypothetical protein